MDPLSKASFGLNETLRIVIPGYYSLALIYLYFIADKKLSGYTETFPVLMIGLALGFIFYSWDYPNKRHVYNTGLPSNYLLKRSKDLAITRNKPEIELKSQKPEQEHIEFYFYILNNFLSPTFHEVVITRGSLYYCVTYVWFISGIFGAVGFVSLLIGRCISVLTGDQSLWIFGCSLIQLLIFFVLRVVFNRMDRTLSTIYKNQITWMKLNDLLVEYLLVNRVDPRVHDFVPGEQIERDSNK
jgi:hypothetical protein